MSPLRSHAIDPRPRQNGGAVVEFALLLTLLISLVAGILEFGRTFWYYDALSKATRNGARAVSVSASADILDAVDAARAAVLADAISAGVPDLEDDHITIECLDVAMTVANCVAGTAPAGVRVSVTGYDMALGTVIPFLLDSATTYDVRLAPSTTMPYMK